MSEAAAFFDLDKTIIATSSTLALGKTFYAAGMISRRDIVKGAYAKFVYHLGRVDEAKMDRMRADLVSMVTGWEADTVREVVSGALGDLIDTLIYVEAAALIDDHRAAGRAIVLVSSSGEEIVQPVGEILGADHVVATRMVVQEGKYTGKVEFYAFGPHKATAMRALAAEHGWDLGDCYAYSDSGTDVPMLETVGHPFAVNPDKALRKQAGERNWPILDFDNPVPLRSRFPKIPGSGRQQVAVGLAGAAVVAAAAGWKVARNARQ